MYFLNVHSVKSNLCCFSNNAHYRKYLTAQSLNFQIIAVAFTIGFSDNLIIRHLCEGLLFHYRDRKIVPMDHPNDDVLESNNAD